MPNLLRAVVVTRIHWKNLACPHLILDRKCRWKGEFFDRAFSAAPLVALHPEPNLASSAQAGSTMFYAIVPLSHPSVAAPECRMKSPVRSHPWIRPLTIFACRFGLAPFVRGLPAWLDDFQVGSFVQALRRSHVIAPLGSLATVSTVPQALALFPRSWLPSMQFQDS